MSVRRGFQINVLEYKSAHDIDLNTNLQNYI
jgi:hypothetical protein